MDSVNRRISPQSEWFNPRRSCAVESERGPGVPRPGGVLDLLQHSARPDGPAPPPQVPHMLQELSW